MEKVRKDIQHVKDRELGRYNNKKYRFALKEIERLEREVEAFRATTVPPSKRKITRTRGEKRSQATAIAMASDWHVDEIVKPSTVQGLNKYNPDIAKERADRFWSKVVSLTSRNRFDTTVDNLVLILGGDFISSNIHEELLENTAMRPLEAIIFAQDLIDAGLRHIKEEGGFKKVVVICCAGNHSRITRTMYYQTRNGNSLEWAMYQNLAKRHPDFEWVIEDGYLTYYKVYNQTLRIHHGDAIRYAGGVGGLDVPMKRAYYQWNMTQHADLNFMGHYHQYTPGSNLVNGSLIGYNAYAAQNKFSFQEPTQALVILDEQKGVTFHIPIYV